MELLAPAGSYEKLKTAIYFGADAVYVGGKNFSLRAYADNFSDEELASAVEYCHARGKKLYVTVNIFARNADLPIAEKYFAFLQKIGVDAAIVTDTGLIALAATAAPKLNIHLSTQANTLNYKTVQFWAKNGVKRVILARELSFSEIKEIASVGGVEVECFAHGAMCISYSGRCLLSNYLTNRDSNRGECVQACRWNYEIRERNSGGDFLPIAEDERGTYILNSKDLNMIEYLDRFAEAGVASIKIEGRMKSEYYLATVIGAYRRALDAYEKMGADYKKSGEFYLELIKTAHRSFTTAYMLGKNDMTVNYADTQSRGERTFIANVVGYADGYAEIEMRNRFKKGDVLEVLSPDENLNKQITVGELKDIDGNAVEDAKLVQQKLFLKTDIVLHSGDFLRK